MKMSRLGCTGLGTLSTSIIFTGHTIYSLIFFLTQDISQFLHALVLHHSFISHYHHVFSVDSPTRVQVSLTENSKENKTVAHCAVCNVHCAIELILGEKSHDSGFFCSFV